MNYLKVILAILLLTSCQTTGLKIGNVDVGKLVNQGVKVWDASMIDETQESQLGENISAVLLGVRPLHQNVEVNQYVNHVGRWLAQNSTRPELPWHFGVIDSDAINAFAAPGGYVFITSGMLMQLNSEAELAAVLAHEISHVTLAHHLNALKSGALRGAVTEALFVSADAYQANTGADREQRQYAAWAKTVTSAAQDLYSKGLDRTDEMKADERGLRLMARAGYDPYAYISSLQVIEAISPDDSSLALLYKTHPTATERITHIQQTLVEVQHVKGKTLIKRFQQTLSGQRNSS
ncbi:M48 family metalloprotease [Thalassotalea sp. M1531]|uniref:M48 family metalloprotease n=1 Tax=Thalassotalea algicola TaxID=2716224 RepID=A0A7Y0LEU9_9GAMM|nr:M48 family metalloprotease [Thalassotalea algicola]NMP33234.1 M48 family metalloprotease [Thalassotalea algicola]